MFEEINLRSWNFERFYYDSISIWGVDKTYSELTCKEVNKEFVKNTKY